MEKYIETVSKETEMKIENFINNNPGEEVPFETWKEGMELYRKAFAEIRESVKEFGRKYDNIIENYKVNQNIEIDQNEIALVNDTNKKLRQLYENYFTNEKIREQLDIIASMKIKR